MNKTRGLFFTASMVLAITFTFLCPAAYANEAVEYHLKGIEAMKKKEYDKAISEFNEAIRLDPKFFKAYTMRGFAYYFKKDYDKAISDCSEAIRLDPKFETAYNIRGDAYYEKKEYDKAISDYTQVIRLEPNFGVYFHRGRAYYEKKEYDKAIADYTQALRLDPKDATTYMNRGHVYNFKEDYDKAIADYTEAIRLKPELPELYNYRGSMYCEKGDNYKNIKKDYQSASQSYGKAIEDFQSSLRINPNDKNIQELLKKVETIRLPIENMLKFQSGSSNTSGNELTDARDSKKYKSVKIGSQTWMAENLNYEASGSKCYDNNSGNCAKYGRLYDWNTAKKVCPAGWHLPTEAEWEEMNNAVGGSSVAGTKLKAKSGWNKGGNGTDEYGFSALPGGFGNPVGFFFNVGDLGDWWSATEYNSDFAYYRGMDYYNSKVYRDGIDKFGLFSVRCVKD
jgi:uncharacterized protein (TIGR02145 family)